MPGEISVLTNLKVGGWAKHPYLSEYHVVVHVVHETQILCSSIADQPPSSLHSETTNSWFHMSLSDFQLTEPNLQKLSLLIGETDEILDKTRVGTPLPKRQITLVEDLINANTKRSWVTGATYVEGMQAGLVDADIIDLLYRDILGRPADPAGLANYLFQLREGIRAINDIRKSLYDSEEYTARLKNAAHAPGAIFSQPIALLAASALFEFKDTNMKSRNESIENPIAVEPIALSWPSYPERHVGTNARLSHELLEVQIPLDSVLFGSGWHNVETLDNIQFRWMEKAGILFNPRPELPCIQALLTLDAVYGAHVPMLDCFFDDEIADISIVEKDRGFLINVSPTFIRPYTKLRIESRVSGCPVQEDRGTDQRILSLSIVSVVVAYRSATSFLQ